MSPAYSRILVICIMLITFGVSDGGELGKRQNSLLYIVISGEYQSGCFPCLLTCQNIFSVWSVFLHNISTILTTFSTIKNCKQLEKIFVFTFYTLSFVYSLSFILVFFTFFYTLLEVCHHRVSFVQIAVI